MSMWTRSGIRPSVAATESGSGRTSRKLPPDAKSTSSSPRPAASIIAGAVSPGSAGTVKPQRSRERRGVLGVDLGRRPGTRSRSSPSRRRPGRRSGRGSASARSPRGRSSRGRAPRLTIARTLSSPRSCWVTPMLQTRTPVLGGGEDRARTPPSARGVVPATQLELLPARRLGDRAGPRRSPRCGRRRRRASTAPVAIRLLQRADEEADVAAGVDGEEVVGDLRPEQRALGLRGDPVALHPRLAVRVDDDHLRARPSWRRAGTSSRPAGCWPTFEPMKTIDVGADPVACRSRSSRRRRARP